MMDNPAKTDACLAELKMLPNLELLQIDTMPVDEAGHGPFQGWKSADFPVHGDPVTVEGIKHIGRLTHLRHLGINGADIDDEALAQLGGLTELSSLGVLRTPISGTGLRYLSPLKQLESINLSQTMFTAGHLKYLCAMTNLKRLALSRSHIHGPGLRGIAPKVIFQSGLP